MTAEPLIRKLLFPNRIFCFTVKTLLTVAVSTWWHYGICQGGFKYKFQIPNCITANTRDVIQAPNGNYIVIGYATDTTGNNSFGAQIIAGTDSLGNALWIKKYGSPQMSYLDNVFASVSVGMVDDSGFSMVGSVKATLGSLKTKIMYCGRLTRFNYAGDTIWQKIWCDSLKKDIIPHAIAESIDGGLLITGLFQNWLTGEQPLLLLKTDGAGNELWRKRINKPLPNNHWGNAILQDAATGRIIIIGSQLLNNSCSNLVITDSVGKVMVQKSFGLKTSPFLTVIRSKDGHFITGGSNNTSEKYPYECFAVLYKFNSNGDNIFAKGYNDYSFGNSVALIDERDDGDLVFYGKVDNSSEYVQPQLVRTDPDGNIKWKRYFGEQRAMAPQQYETASSFRRTKDGGYVLALSYMFDPAPTPFSIIKLDSLGCDTTPEVCAERLITFLGEDAKPGNFKFFPNPANDKIVFVAREMPSDGATIEITDISGREVKRIEILRQETVIDISDLTPGAYLARYVVAGSPSVTRKVVVAR